MQPIAQVIKDNNQKPITNNPNTLMPDSKKVREVQETAIYLMQKLHAPASSQAFYLKAAWSIKRARLDWMVGTALEMGRNPGAYFNCLVRAELSK